MNPSPAEKPSLVRDLEDIATKKWMPDDASEVVARAADELSRLAGELARVEGEMRTRYIPACTTIHALEAKVNTLDYALSRFQPNVFFIDGMKYRTELPSMSGALIKAAAGKCPSYQLMQGPDETLEPAKPVSDTESVCMTGGTRYFYCVVPCTF